MTERSKARIGFFLYLLTLLVFNTQNTFMILNMFLAFAALEIAYLLPLFNVKSKIEIVGSLLMYSTFILLAPNTLYVLTDLIHLNRYVFNFRKELALVEWWNFTVLVAGVLLAVYYHTLIVKQVELLVAKLKYRQLYVVIFMLLCSLGIYIGRFLRFHSIHIFTEPMNLIETLFGSMNLDSIMFMIFIFVLQLIIYALFMPKKGR
ncbi:DUF1361 domain-containing protein [Bacillus bombysepticus]|uniref:DUF1361 domain-containing protein n=1 Tax=Bacillus bombysepticus TaxID=658666 RepID=UPI003019173B